MFNRSYHRLRLTLYIARLMTPQDLVTRCASSSDASTIATLSAIPQALHVAAHPEFFKVPDTEELEHWYRTMLDRVDVHAWLAEIDAIPVGYVLAIDRETEAFPVCFARRWLELDQIGVSASARRKGVARALAGCVFEHAREHGFERVELGTWAFNRDAQRAFEALGFAPQRLRYSRVV